MFTEVQLESIEPFLVQRSTGYFSPESDCLFCHYGLVRSEAPLSLRPCGNWCATCDDHWSQCACYKNLK